MKVIHIGDKAAVACLLSKQHKLNGGESKVFKRSKYNPTGSVEFYGEASLDYPPKKFIDYCVEMSKDYDIAHVHGLHKIIPKLDIPVVFHQHGSDLFKNIGNDLMLECVGDAPVIVSTEDMVTPAKRYYERCNLIKNAPDTDHFKKQETTSKKALCITCDYIDRDALDNYLKDIDLDVEVIDRGQGFIPYSDMPSMFSEYGYYIDIKPLKRNKGKDINVRSKTGLEALAIGLKVITTKGVVEGLPEDRTPEYQYKQVRKVYDSLYSANR